MADGCKVNIKNTFLDLKYPTHAVLSRCLSDGDLPRIHQPQIDMQNTPDHDDNSIWQTDPLDVPHRAAPRCADADDDEQRGRTAAVTSAVIGAGAGGGTASCSEDSDGGSTGASKSSGERPSGSDACGDEASDDNQTPFSTQGATRAAEADDVCETQQDRFYITVGGSSEFFADISSPSADCGPEPELWEGARPEAQTQEQLLDIFRAVADVNALLDHIHSDIAQVSVDSAIQALQSLADSVDRGVACDDTEWQALEPRFFELVRLVRANCGTIGQSSLVAQMVWCFGKLNVGSPDVVAALEQCIAKVHSSADMTFTPPELADMLWGLGRLADRWPACRPPAKRFSRWILQASLHRLSEFSPLSLSNAIWAVAKLRLAAVGLAGGFAKSCVAQLCTEGCLRALPTHSFVTSLWAVARLRLDIREVSALCAAIAREVDLEQTRLFTSTQLSIATWSMAKMTRKCVRRKEAATGEQPNARACASDEANEGATTILLALTSEAFRRIAEFEPPALTNISWALKTLALTGDERARPLVDAACLTLPFKSLPLENQDINCLC